MRREKNLLPRVVDFDNLYRAFSGASHGKRDRPEVREFEYHLETRLWEIRDELETGEYAWGPFHRFWVRDPKRREIRAAPFRDRVVHHAPFGVLDPIFQRGFIADSYACIPGRGTHRAAQRYRAFVRARAGRGYRVQGDVKSYFASVDHEVLRERLRRRIGDRRLLDLLGTLVAHGAERPGRGMPIGSLTSQLFANVYLDTLDHFVKERLRLRHYLRYMDDFLLLASDRRASASDRARSVLSTLTEITFTPWPLRGRPGFRLTRAHLWRLAGDSVWNSSVTLSRSNAAVRRASSSADRAARIRWLFACVIVASVGIVASRAG